MEIQMDAFLLDETDCRILAVLQLEGRISNMDLAERVSLSPSACLRRIRLLEGRGVVERYRACLSRDALGFEIEAFVQVSLVSDGGKRHAGFAAALRDWKEVIEAFVVTGHTQYMLRVIAPSIKHYSDFVHQRLHKVPGVTKISSNILMKTLKDEPGLPVALLASHEPPGHTKRRTDSSALARAAPA
jgi:Lrp/AsnC family transcriptional regulator, leucine-responsive regulatory protein